MSENETQPEVRADAPGATAPETEPVEEFIGPNAQARQAYLECNLRIQRALAAGDTEAEATARKDRARIANEFVTRNERLAMSIAASWTAPVKDAQADHRQAALLGLWEAFAGTTPEDVDGVLIAEDGTLRPTGGWDPSRSTFGGWATHAISGKVRRSVSRVEYGGMSYYAWTTRPVVRQAVTDLTERLGRAPSDQEVAAAAGVSVEMVRTCRTAAPLALDATVGGEPGGATLGDLIEQSHEAATFTDDEDQAAGKIHDAIAAKGITAVLVWLMRDGVTGLPARTGNQAAFLLGKGRGVINTVHQHLAEDVAAALTTAEPAAGDTPGDDALVDDEPEQLAPAPREQEVLFTF